MSDPTTNPNLGSWVEVAADSDFPIQNLPFGVFSIAGSSRRIGVAIGDRILDLAAVQNAGLLELEALPSGVFDRPVLNPFLSLDHVVHRATRERISELLAAGNNEPQEREIIDRALVAAHEATLHLPITIGDYVDFYSSQQHAMNVGRILRPEGSPLMANWKHLPVGYHGRSSSIVVSGTDIIRPRGQLPRPDGPPEFGVSQRLDIELEVGFVTGLGNESGTPIPVAQAEEHIFGMCLVNDWSARDIQAWEYQPLGPFLGKSFATTVSPWIVPLDALAPYRVAAPPQDPTPLPYLLQADHGSVDLHLEIELIPADGKTGAVIARSEFREIYWTMAQQLAHATSNGAAVAPGDLFASGTVSGSEPGSFGSLLELTWNGKNPLRLPNGSERSFLEDGDTVILRGWCGGEGQPRIGFGECTGTIRRAVT